MPEYVDDDEDRPLWWYWDRETDALRPVARTDPLALTQWSERNRVVQQDHLPNKLFVSTVFLGIDHSFSLDPADPPILFETMVFPPDSAEDLACARYQTAAEARIGHAKMVRQWRRPPWVRRLFRWWQWLQGRWDPR